MPTASLTAPSSAASHRQTRVLLVSARVDEREAFACALQRRGFCTLQAATDRDGERLTELAPDAIVVDLVASHRLSDVDAQLWFRHERWSRFVPVILLADTPLPPAVEEAARASCYFVLSKPCAPDALSDAITTLLAS